MPVTTIDATSALIVIDLQQGHAQVRAAHPINDVIARSAALADAFRALRLPVVLVTVNGRAPGRTDRGAAGSAPLPDGYDRLLDELHPHDTDIRIGKRRWGAFTGTDLDDALRSRGVTQVVVTGVATSVGVESTARSAYEHGYHVVIATDAVTDPDAEAHDNSVGRIFPKLGETATTAEILALLARGEAR